MDIEINDRNNTLRLLDNKIKNAEHKIEEINLQYETQQQYIKNIESLAAQRQDQLNKDYEQRKQQYDKDILIHIQTVDEQLQEVKDNLASLKATREAVVEAWRREEEKIATQDYYRLDITQADKQDIQLLNSIKNNISNPRVINKVIWQTYYQPLAKKKFAMILGNETIIGIYKITNCLNNKVYIGQSRDIYKRWNEHCKCGAGLDTPINNKLYTAMLKDGLDNFTFEVLEQCSPQQLNEKESFYIDLYQSVNYGYNSISGIGG